MSWSFLALSMWSFISAFLAPPPSRSPGELCPQSHTADSIHTCRHLKDSNPVFTRFIFFMSIIFYYIYPKHLAGEGSRCWPSSDFPPHQLLTEAVSRSLWELLLKWPRAAWPPHSSACGDLSLGP